MYIDYYKILGINKSATQEDVKKAYRKLARKHHPDLNPGDKSANKKFQEINEANEVLGDPEKRKKYDKYGKDWKHSEEFERAQQSQRQSAYSGEQAYSGSYSGGNFSDFAGGGFSDFSGGNFSDFFESMFGGAAGSGSTGERRQRKFRGEDFHAELQLNLTDAFQTHKQTFNINGKNIRITIPAGIENGQTIKISGHGAKGSQGGPAGDLYITFSIKNNTTFRRLGNDLHSTVNLDLYTAVLGGELTLDTMSGKVKVKVKPGTQNGSKIKLKNKGFPVYKKEGSFGDLYISFNVLIPENLSAQEKELFTSLASIKK
jgi:curved DNA-binding protein